MGVSARSGVVRTAAAVPHALEHRVHRRRRCRRATVVDSSVVGAHGRSLKTSICRLTTSSRSSPARA
nr:hypothetical protein [Tawny frogmouth aviadenovirus A]